MSPRSPEQRVARLLDARLGLKTNVSFRPRLARALRDLGRARSLDGGQLADALPTDASLLDDLIDRVTVQETGFFRHPQHFDVISEHLLPGIDGPPRAWSAAAANGQEAYSLAMVFREAGRTGSVLATDISEAALRRTREARYRSSEMRGVSESRRTRHFDAEPDCWQLAPPVRSMVVTARHNLIDPLPDRVRDCHLVLCRNVLIYLGVAHAQVFLARLADVMRPDAVLLVGSAETIWQTTDRFEPLAIGGCYAFRPVPAPPRWAARVEPRPALVPSRTESPASTPAATPSPAPSEPAQASGPAQQARQLLAEGAVPDAIAAYRRWSYQCPDDPLAHFELGAALEQHDDPVAARRAYRAALSALDRARPEGLADVLQGYERAALRDLLLLRAGLGAAAPSDSELDDLVDGT